MRAAGIAASFAVVLVCVACRNPTTKESLACDNMAAVCERPSLPMSASCSEVADRLRNLPNSDAVLDCYIAATSCDQLRGCETFPETPAPCRRADPMCGTDVALSVATRRCAEVLGAVRGPTQLLRRARLVACLDASTECDAFRSCVDSMSFEIRPSGR